MNRISTECSLPASRRGIHATPLVLPSKGEAQEPSPIVWLHRSPAADSLEARAVLANPMRLRRCLSCRSSASRSPHRYGLSSGIGSPLTPLSIQSSYGGILEAMIGMPRMPDSSPFVGNLAAVNGVRAYGASRMSTVDRACR